MIFIWCRSGHSLDDEAPHDIGDFAVLLQNGVSKTRQIFVKQVENSDSFAIEADEMRNYIYGVALSTSEPTSGPVWTACEIDARAHVGQVRKLEAPSDTDTTEELEGETGCVYQRKYVARYQAEYYQMLSPGERQTILL